MLQRLTRQALQWLRNTLEGAILIAAALLVVLIMLGTWLETLANAFNHLP